MQCIVIIIIKYLQRSVYSMNIGYFKFNSKKEAERREELFSKMKDVQKVFAGDSVESFFEFIDGMEAEGNVVYITSFADIGRNISEQIESLKVVDEYGLRLVDLSGIEHEPLFNLDIATLEKAKQLMLRLALTGKLR